MNNAQTRGLAQFISGLKYEAIPSEVRERLKLLILDALGCALYGAELEWCRILRRTVADKDDSCAIWGTKERMSAPHAALVNGTQVQSFELDDVHRAGVLHVGAVVLPALLAVAELKRNLSGREFLAAAAAGYETGPRVGLCMGPEHIGQGWHSGATVGVFAAGAAAARGLKLDAEKTVHALGISGTQSAGLMAAQYGAMVKRMHAGRSSQSGLYGGLLAEQGFTGIENVFEAEYGGFATTFSRSTDRFRLQELTAGLGTTWQTMGVALKFYSCVASNHTSLDAVRDMRRERPFAADQVKAIRAAGRAQVPRRGRRAHRRARLAGHRRPRGMEVRALGDDCGAAQPAVLRRDLAAGRRLLRRSVQAGRRARSAAHGARRSGAGDRRSADHRARREA